MSKYTTRQGRLWNRKRLSFTVGGTSEMCRGGDELRGCHALQSRPDFNSGLFSVSVGLRRTHGLGLMPVKIYYFCSTLISLNLDSARSNLSLKSHIAFRISRTVADVFALSACPKVKMLLLRK